MLSLAIAALCALSAAAFVVFVLALCKAAAISDEMMDKIVAAYNDGDGDYLGG